MPDAGSARPLIVYTRFETSKHTSGIPKLQTLPEFAAACRISYRRKDLQPLCIPDQLPDHSRASGLESSAATSIMLDFDKPSLSISQAISQLRTLNAAHVLYCTYSWTKERPKYRIVLPLSRPIEIPERRRLIARLGKLIPGIAPETGDAKRGFYVGTNGGAAPKPIWKDGLTADNLKLPEAESLPSKAGKSVNLYDSPSTKAAELMAVYGHKLKNGEGRWSAVEYLATRVSARQYDAEKCYEFLNMLIATYFDASDVTSVERAKWQTRIRYWLDKDQPKRRESLVQGKTKPSGSLPEGLPQSFSAADLLDMQLPETEWVIEGLLPPGLALLAGAPKIGKSRLALQLALATASGTKWLGTYQAIKCLTIYYDLESGHHLLKERLIEMMPEANLTKKDIDKKLSFSLVLETGANAILQLRQELQAMPDVRLVIIDLFARIRDGENAARKSVYQLDYDTMAQFQDICAEYPSLCILLVHHANKRSISQTDHWQDSISGSAGLAGATHTNFLINRISKQGLTEEEYEVMRQYALLNIAGKRVKDVELTLHQPVGSQSWEISSKKLHEVKSSKLQSEIVAVLESDKKRLWSSTEVAAALAKNHNTVKEVMRRMAASNLLVSPTGKGYCTSGNKEKEKAGPSAMGRPKGTRNRTEEEKLADYLAGK